MHRVLMNAPNDMEVDHINGNPSDNRLSNLRLVTRRQNCLNHRRSKRNSSGRTGVSWANKGKKWIATIQIGLTTIPLGRFEKKEDAIVARDKAEKEYFGEYARSQVNPRTAV